MGRQVWFSEHFRGGKAWITERVPFVLWSIWIPLHVLIPLERERKEEKERRRETQAPCLRSVGFDFLPAPFLKASPSAFWVNNPKKSTQSTTSPTVNETSVYVRVKTRITQNRELASDRFQCWDYAGSVIDWSICSTRLFWPVGLFWVTFAMSFKSTGELLLQPLSLSVI